MTLQVLLLPINAGSGSGSSSGTKLSALRHSTSPEQLWLCCMELHAQILCPTLSTMPRSVQLSKKASFRQDLTRLRLPYRLATRQELDALKSAGQLSIQAPSTMLMKLSDGVRLLNEKSQKKARRQIVRQWREWKVQPVTAKTIARQTSLAPVAAVRAVAVEVSGRGARKSGVDDAARILMITATASSASAPAPVPVAEPSVGDVNIVESSIVPGGDSSDSDSDSESLAESAEVEILSASEWWKMWNAASSAAHHQSFQTHRKNSFTMTTQTTTPMMVAVPRTPTSAKPAYLQSMELPSPPSMLSVDVRALSMTHQESVMRTPLKAIQPLAMPPSPHSSAFIVSPSSAFTPVKKRGRKNFEPYSLNFDMPLFIDTPRSASQVSVPMAVASPVSMLPRAHYMSARAMSLPPMDEHMRKRLKQLR